MPNGNPNNWNTAEAGFAAQTVELATTRERQLAAVLTRTATGSSDLDETVDLDRKFRLVFLRCHFSGISGTAELTLSVDSANGSEYDTQLFAVSQAGRSHDVHLRITDGDRREPSPWTFQVGDSLRIQWTNPDTGNITWGLEVGLALAS